MSQFTLTARAKAASRFGAVKYGRRAELLGNGKWRVDYSGGLVELFDFDPREPERDWREGAPTAPGEHGRHEWDCACSPELGPCPDHADALRSVSEAFEQR